MVTCVCDAVTWVSSWVWASWTWSDDMMSQLTQWKEHTFFIWIFWDLELERSWTFTSSIESYPDHDSSTEFSTKMLGFYIFIKVSLEAKKIIWSLSYYLSLKYSKLKYVQLPFVCVHLFFTQGNFLVMYYLGIQQGKKNFKNTLMTPGFEKKISNTLTYWLCRGVVCHFEKCLLNLLFLGIRNKLIKVFTTPSMGHLTWHGPARPGPARPGARHATERY